MHIVARDPRAVYPAADRLTLAARPVQPDRARFCLVQTMPPGSDLEAPLEAVAAELGRRFPSACIERLLRRDFMIDDPAEREAITARSDAAFVFLGPAATMAHVGWAYGAALEQAGLPVVAAVFPDLEAAVDHASATRGTALRRATMPAPAAFSDAALQAFAINAIDALLEPLSMAEQAGGPVAVAPAERVVEAASPEDLQRLFRERGWTDGLPINLPTQAAVDAMLAGTTRQASDVVTPSLRPEGLVTTVELVAINAVMAGCEPCHLPIVLAAISLFGSLELESMTRSVNSFAFSLLVGGPTTTELSIVGGLNALGQGSYPNGVIARAIDLTLRNCGGLRVGVTSTPAQGNAAGITVFAENAIDSPWTSFHQDEGFAQNEDVVSLFAGGFSILGSFYYRGLDEAARLMTQLDAPTGALLLVSAKRAQVLAKTGLRRRDVAEALWRKASGRLVDFRASGFFPMIKALIERAMMTGRTPPWPPSYLTDPDDTVVPLYPRSSVKVAVVGGAVSSVMQLWGSSLQASAPVAPWR